MSKKLEGASNAGTNSSTSKYVVPEVVQGKYSKDVDVWSLGLVLFYICTISIRSNFLPYQIMDIVTSYSIKCV